MTHPTYCSFGDLKHQAAYSVENPGRRNTVCCGRHLERAKRWAGPGHTVTPLAGHDPPPEQDALF